MRTRLLLLVPAALALAAAMHAAPPAPLARHAAGARGYAVLLEDRGAGQAIALARQSEMTFLVQLADAAQVDAARRAADAAGLLGTRVFVARGGPDRVGLADGIADLLWAPAGVAAAARPEAARVLRPGGKALLGAEEWTKPWPAGVDDWSHHYHGPDNNPQSADRLARAPYRTRFIAAPRYAPAPQAAVSAGGRLFMALGNVAWHEREEPVLNTLMAVSAFNGSLLWKRPLKPGILVDRSTLIATPETLYVADDASCKLLDAATGRQQSEITMPAGPGVGPAWKWMALENGVLYALLGRPEAPDPDARWRSTRHGWPWTGISKGYNNRDYTWGYGDTLLALDPKTKRVLWTHREPSPMDSRGTCMKGGRLYTGSFGRYLTCLDARSGQVVWRRGHETDREVFEAIGPYRPGHGFIEGWKSTVYLKCTDRALYFVGPQVNWLTALSAEDGRFLWKYPAKDLHAVIRDDGVYTIGPERSTGLTLRLDPMTGRVLQRYPVSRRACTRSVGTADGILFRASEGTARLDLAAGQPQWIAPMRPSCHVGVLVASGRLLWVPWACDCDLQVFGIIGCGPADEGGRQEPGDRPGAPAPASGPRTTDAGPRTTDAGPQTTALGPWTLDPDPRTGAPARFDISPADWPTYRADNARTARTQAAVPERVRLLWQVKGRAEPTAPVAAGGLLFAGARDGSVRALDAATGRARWTAYTGGALRYPPAIAGGRALVGSADGWAYAFEAATGRLLWRLRPGPDERRIPVYGALLSPWPVVGVLADGETAYLAAGITPHDGTYVCAVDAATGRPRWTNDESGRLDAFSRRGVAAQGDLLLAGGRLYLAGGNAVSPGIFDAGDGRCLSQPPSSPGSSAPRGRELTLTGGGVSVTGQPLYSEPEFPVYDDSTRWLPQQVQAKNARLLLRGGTSSDWELVAQDASGGRRIWTQPLPGEPVRWGLAVDRAGRIAVALRDGRIVCYGE